MKTFLVTIEIQQDCWLGEFYVGKIVEFTIQCKTKRSIDGILESYNGSEYPAYDVKSIREVGATPFFKNFIKKY